MIQENKAFSTPNPTLQALHDEADLIQRFMTEPANIQDPASMTERLRMLDSYMARLGEMTTTAKAYRRKAKNDFQTGREDLNKLTATVSNRIIDAHMQDYDILYDRLDTMYETIRHLSRDLVTQISYQKEQMRNFGA